MADRVQRLAHLAGVAPDETRAFDWAAIEADLGRPLPDDYKLLAETFPEGWFRGWVRIWLPDLSEDGHPRLLSDFTSGQMEALREFRDTGECLFPFPLFPEPGGVLPWGQLHSIGTAYWLTGPGDADEWPVIIATEEGDHWQRFDGPLSEFLIEVTTGRYDASEFPDNTAGWGSHVDLGSRPPFWTDAQEQAREESVLRAYDAAAMRFPLLPAFLRGTGETANEMPLLRELLGAPAPGAPRMDWDRVHARLGLRLPADYREFIDTYGAGTLEDIRITAPGAPGRMDLFELLERTQAQAREKGGVYLPPFYPEPGGMVCWGEDDRGSILGWGPNGDDPDGWLVVVMDADLRRYGQEDGLSFSGLLGQYVRGELGHLPRRDPPGGPVTFTPSVSM